MYKIESFLGVYEIGSVHFSSFEINTLTHIYFSLMYRQKRVRIYVCMYIFTYVRICLYVLGNIERRLIAVLLGLWIA